MRKCRVCGWEPTPQEFKDNFMASGTICFECYQKEQYRQKTMRLDAERAIELEKLARQQAFHDFKKQILQSLLVYQIDENVRTNLVPIITWIESCNNEITEILKSKEVCK